MLTHRTALCSLVLLLTACANYDFARARTPDGRVDMKKLVTDLEASGKPQLSNGLWIPGIYLNLTTFQANALPNLPDGYTLDKMTGVGPIFFAGGRDQTLLDKQGNQIEESDRDWLGWGLLWDDHDQRVETSHGLRCEGRLRYLGVFGRESLTYVKRP